jgi:hypothetical protein
MVATTAWGWHGTFDAASSSITTDDGVCPLAIMIDPDTRTRNNMAGIPKDADAPCSSPSLNEILSNQYGITPDMGKSPDRVIRCQCLAKHICTHLIK